MIVAIKHTASIKGLTPEMMAGWMIVTAVFFSFNAEECTVTSGVDSKHGKDTLHQRNTDDDPEPDCNALDFRTKTFKGDKFALRDRCRSWLGPQFDVVLEALNTDNEHMHVEFDPKG